MLKHQHGGAASAAGQRQIDALTHDAHLQYRHLRPRSAPRKRLAIDHTGALVAAKENTSVARFEKCPDVKFGVFQAIALAEFSDVGEVLRGARQPVAVRQPDKPLLILGYADKVFDRCGAAVQRVLKVGRSRLSLGQAPDMRSTPIAAYPQIPVGILEETPDQGARQGALACVTGLNQGEAIIRFVVKVQAALGAHIDGAQRILKQRCDDIVTQRMRVIGDVFEPCKGAPVFVQNVQSAQIRAHQKLA